MVVLTLVIGVLNLYLGCLVAVRLGYGPPGLWEAWEALSFDPRTQQPAISAEEPLPDNLLLTHVQPSIEEVLDDGSAGGTACDFEI